MVDFDALISPLEKQFPGVDIGKLIFDPPSGKRMQAAEIVDEALRISVVLVQQIKRRMIGAIMSDRSRAAWLRRTMAAFGLILFAITWRLWTPQTEFPQIPFFGWLTEVPGIVDWIAAAGTLMGLLGMLLTNRRLVKPAIVLFLISTSLLVLLNQHRLQPWVYLMLVTGCLLVSMPSKICLTWLRRIVISIYIYSAISKFDYQFVFTVGEQMLNVLLGFIGLETTGLPQWLQVSLVLCLPLGEFLIGGLLLFSKTRRLGGWLAMGLHASLLLILGPLGLNHQPGVLIWNAWFIAQAWLLFASSKPSKAVQKGSDLETHQNLAAETRRSSIESPPVELIWFGRLLASFVIAFPITCAVSPWVELPIKADHWVAWEVYAPRSSRALVQVPAWTHFRPFARPTVIRHAAQTSDPQLIVVADAWRTRLSAGSFSSGMLVGVI